MSKFIVVTLLTIASIISMTATACPNLNGTFRNKEDTANITLKYTQTSCSELQIQVFIDDQEKLNQTYQADGVFRTDTSKGPTDPRYIMAIFTADSFVVNTLLVSYIAEKNKVEMVSAVSTLTLKGITLIRKLEYFHEDGSSFPELGSTTEFEKIGE